MIESTFRRSVRAHGLLSPGDRVLAAVSGGADSVGLLRLLLDHSRSLPFEVLVAHVNHKLRGATADEDEEFVRGLASDCGVEFVALSAGSRRRPEAGGASEEGLRRMRHSLLRSAAARAGAGRIAIGHTMDDQAETVLLRLLRGTGRRGLSGMAFAGPGRLIRPMLSIRREEVRAWLAAIGQPFREDETNLDPKYLRNKVRARLLPLMAEINPSIVPALARTAAILGEEDRYLDEIAAEALARDARPSRIPDGVSAAASARALARMPVPIARRVARLLIKGGGGDPRGAPLRAVEDLLDLAGASGERAPRPLGGNTMAVLEGEDIVVRAAGSMDLGEAAPIRATLPIPGRVEIPATGGFLTASLHDPGGLPEPGPRCAHLDAALLGDAVTVRNRLPGDRFHPLGAPGGRKLKEFLIDCKVPRRDRDRIPLLIGPAGIAWVVGQRISHTYRVRNSTRRVAVIDYQGPA